MLKLTRTKIKCIFSHVTCNPGLDIKIWLFIFYTNLLSLSDYCRGENIKTKLPWIKTMSIDTPCEVLGLKELHTDIFVFLTIITILKVYRCD